MAPSIALPFLLLATMSTNEPRPPLWRVMHDAYLRSALSWQNLVGPEGHIGFAAEIRAIADEIDGRFLVGVVPDPMAIEIALWLRIEANRSEAGE